MFVCHAQLYKNHGIRLCLLNCLASPTAEIKTHTLPQRLLNSYTHEMYYSKALFILTF